MKFVIFVILLIIVFALLKENQGAVQFHVDKSDFMKWAIVCIPVIIYFFFVSESAAYVTDRYIFPIYAVTFGMFMCAVTAILKKVFSEQNLLVATCLVAAIIIVNGLGNAKWDYLYKHTLDLLNKASTFADLNCICVYDVSWKEAPAYFELRNYKSVTFIRQGDVGRIVDYDNLFGNGFILTVTGGNDEQVIAIVKEKYPYLDKYEKLGEYAYSTTYRIYADIAQ